MNETQLPFDARNLAFDGVTYEAEFDHARLHGYLASAYQALSDGKWWTLDELHSVVGGSVQGISARIRDLRKPRYGSHVIERRRRGDPKQGVFEYRLSTS